MNWRNVFHLITVLSTALAVAGEAIKPLAVAVPALLPVAAGVALASTVLHLVIKGLSDEGMSPLDNSYHTDGGRA